MNTNDFYEVDGYEWFIPVDLIEENKCTKELEVVATESGRITFVPTIYKFQKPPEPQKVTVQKFVAEWVEYCKSNKFTLLGAFDPVSEHGIGLANTFTGEVRKCVDWAQRNQDALARAWLDGYEIEQEKLYAVEIPNPNNEYSMNALTRLPSSGKIALVALHRPNTSYFKNKEYQLTESEIKEDFEWAWQWAKEVE